MFGESQHTTSSSWAFTMNNTVVKALRILQERNCLTLLIQHFLDLFDDYGLSFVSKACITFGNSTYGEMLKVSKLEVTLEVTEFNSPFQFYTQFQCVGFPLTHPSNSQTPAGCPTIQLNCDTIYLDTASAPTDFRLSPTRLSPFRHQL